MSKSQKRLTPEQTLAGLKILQHAKWHCLFGSDSTERTPDVGDLEAASILEELSGAL